MTDIWIYTLGSTVLVSVLALVGILTLCFSQKHLKKIVILLVSFSAGALIGDAFIHILPEAVEEFGFDLSLSLSVIAGILVYWFTEDSVAKRRFS